MNLYPVLLALRLKTSKKMNEIRRFAQLASARIMDAEILTAKINDLIWRVRTVQGNARNGRIHLIMAVDRQIGEKTAKDVCLLFSPTICFSREGCRTISQYLSNELAMFSNASPNAEVRNVPSSLTGHLNKQSSHKTERRTLEVRCTVNCSTSFHTSICLWYQGY